jgi:DNA modification methylase
VTVECACAHCGQEFSAEPEGGHRLLCGDSTSADDVARLMDGNEADICFTSPPYAQQRNYETGPQDWDALMSGVFSILPVKHDAQVLVNLGLVHRDCEWHPYWSAWIEWMRSAGWRRFGWYEWDQGSGMPGDWNGRLAPSHEFIFHFNHVAERPRKTVDKKPEFVKVRTAGRTMRGKDGTLRPFTNDQVSSQPTKIPDSVIRVVRYVSPPGGIIDHPAIFPMALVAEMLTAFSDPGDLAFEPFCGSGTQIMAAEANARRCYAVEIASAYVDIAVRRWSNFTGRTAVLAGDGRSFDEIAAARGRSAAA